MAKKDTDAGRATEPRETDPSMGADDRVEGLRGTADDESDEFDDDGEDDEVEDEDESDEGSL